MFCPLVFLRYGLAYQDPASVPAPPPPPLLSLCSDRSFWQLGMGRKQRRCRADPLLERDLRHRCTAWCSKEGNHFLKLFCNLESFFFFFTIAHHHYMTIIYCYPHLKSSFITIAIHVIVFFLYLCFDSLSLCVCVFLFRFC